MLFFVGSEVTFVKVPSDDPARKPANTTGFPDELGDTRGFREV